MDLLSSQTSSLAAEFTRGGPEKMRASFDSFDGQ